MRLRNDALNARDRTAAVFFLPKNMFKVHLHVLNIRRWTFGEKSGTDLFETMEAERFFNYHLSYRAPLKKVTKCIQGPTNRHFYSNLMSVCNFTHIKSLTPYFVYLFRAALCWLL